MNTNTLLKIFVQVSPTLINTKGWHSGSLHLTTRHTKTGKEECTLCLLVSSLLSQSDTSRRICMFLTNSMSGLKQEANTTYSLKKFSACPTSGLNLQKNWLTDWWQLAVTQPSNLLCGNISMVVLGHHKSLQITTLTNILFVLLWPLHPLPT